MDDVCPSWSGVSAIFCFENPAVDQLQKLSYDASILTDSVMYYECGDLATCPRDLQWLQWTGEPLDWQGFVSLVTGRGAEHSNDCFICGCLRTEGCFPPGVKITMADGSLRNIEDVRAGDLVRNGKTGAPVKVRQVIEGPEALPLLRFGFDGTTVTTSQAHPVLTAAGLKPANELKRGDTIFDARGNPHTLTILEMLPLEEGQRVINVSLDAASSDTDERLIVSDGIITGDIELQALLKKQPRL